LPFSAQALTTHWAAWPRVMLDWDGCRLTHSSGGGGGAVVTAPNTALSMAVAVAVVLALGLPELVDAEVLGGAGVVVVVPLVLADGLVDGEVVGVPLVLADGVVDGLAGGLAGGTGRTDAGGLGDGDVVGTLSCWHCKTVGVEITLPVVDAARVGGAIATLAANPAVAVNKVPPVMRLIVTGRTRAKHM